MPEDYGEVDGSVRFGAAGVWIGAYFRLQDGRVAIRRRITLDIHWLEFDQIKGVDEIAPATAGDQTIEFTLTDRSVVGAQLPTAFVAELIGRLTGEPPASIPTPNSPTDAATAPVGVQGLSVPPTKSNPLAGVSKPKLALVAGAMLAAVAIAVTAGWWFLFGSSSDPTLPGPDAMAVEFTLFDLEDDIVGTLGDCSGVGGYSDFGAGMDIEITNQDGKIIGSGTALSLSMLEEEEPAYFEANHADTDLDRSAEIICIVAALIPLEGKSDFYKIDVGRRGDLSYSYGEMEENDWSVELSLE